MMRYFTCSLPPFERREILRYMGAGQEDAATASLVDACLAECDGIFTCRAAYDIFPVKRTENGLDLHFAVTESRDLAKALAGCDRVLLFAATIGFGIDRLLARYSRLSPAKALCLQAIGAERIEAFCDAFCAEQSTACRLRPRFSPGYGDLPLSLQKEIFALPDITRLTGIVLSENLLMSPTKSVTALAGIE